VHKTQLADRTLWADGISEVRPSELEAAIMAGIPLNSLAVTELTAEVRRLNLLTDNKLTVKEALTVSFPPAWSYPNEYKTLDLDAYLSDLANIVQQDALFEKRLARLAQEILLFEKHDLHELLRVLIYVVDMLRKSKTVWGVGRGSSCSSYILFLIGLHAVDVVKYEIDISDFIR
jgi:DNA polymerase III alpha subunit